MWQLAMQKMLTLLQESIDVVFDGKAISDTTVLSQNLKDQSNTMPYFWLLLGHQETLWPLSHALGLDRTAKLPFGSAFFFDFFTHEA